MILTLGPSLEDVDNEDLVRARSQDFSLTPKDTWDENGVLQELVVWSSSGCRTLLWIGGSSGNQDSWITPFALDMIEAFSTQELTLLYTLCNNTADIRFLTPSTLIKKLISQLLSQHPQLAFQHPRLFNEYRFRNATNFDRLWSIFAQLATLTREIFLIIDRIEKVLPDEDGDVQDKLIPRLLELAARSTSTGTDCDRVSIIVTSTLEAPEDISDDARLSEVYIDTGKRPRKRG